jgi:hypothetical protein
MRYRALAVLLFLAFYTNGIFAQSFSGSLESGLGSWVQSRDILPVPVTFEARVEGKIGNPEEPAGQYAAQVRTAHDPSTASTVVFLKEAWVKAFLGPLDLSVGNQLVSWGSTDVFTPVDVVNPQDLSLPIAAEKKPVSMGRALLNGNGFILDLVAVPFWIGSDLPGARWMSGASSLPAGLVVTSQATSNNLPEATWENAQYGGRFQATLGVFQGFDLGLTYFRGIDTIPTMSVIPTLTGPGTATVKVNLDYDKYSLMGLDAVMAFDGGLMLKAEGNYTVRKDSPWIVPDAGSATAEGVAGWEYTFLGVKTIGEFVLDWAKGASGMDDSYAKTLLFIASADPDARLSLKSMAAYNLDGSGLVSLWATYTLTDGLKTEAKVFTFFGDSTTKYGVWKDNDLFELTLRYYF